MAKDLFDVVAERRANDQRPDTRGLSSIAKAVGLSKTQVHRLIRGDKLPAFMWGGKLSCWNDVLYKWTSNWVPQRNRRADRAA
jgi:hypothetical protein